MKPKVSVRQRDKQHRELTADAAALIQRLEASNAALVSAAHIIRFRTRLLIFTSIMALGSMGVAAMLLWRAAA